MTGICCRDAERQWNGQGVATPHAGAAIFNTNKSARRVATTPGVSLLES